MDALIIVDVQNDFLPGGSLAVSDGDKIVPVINALQEKFELVVATQDWHPEDHGSFASNHEGKEPFDKTMLEGLEQILWPDHCVQSSKGADFSGKLKNKKVEAIFRKGMEKQIDSYSGFFDNGKKKATGLADYLRGRGVERVFIAGLAADVCVGFTTLDALELGFETFVIEDATKPIDEQNWKEMKNDITSRGGKIIMADAV
ncbi:MAG: bifunctional nicotinamidase/pyrazinamidase [Bacteroidota bacterium]